MAHGIVYLLVTVLSLHHTSVSAAVTAPSLGELDICGYFGGTCSTTNCRRQLRHSWGLDLCTNGRNCCARPNNEDQTGSESASDSSSSPTQSQCSSVGGTCQPWYNSCAGVVKEKVRCDHGWQACCVSSAPNADYSSNSRRVTDYSLTSDHSTDPATTFSSTAEPTVHHQPTPNPVSCGIPSRSVRQKRIIGGQVSSPGMWPWHVGIKSAYGNIDCAGTIISKDWVVTAAHCLKGVRNLSLYRIVAGTTGDRTDNTYAIRRIIKHRLYEEHAHTGEQVDHAHKYDIALVQLANPIAFGERVQPACLPSAEESFEAKTCWLTGWGSTRVTDQGARPVLRHVRGTVLSNAQCQTLWGDLVDGKMVCFGNEQLGACRGDSGGGMFCENANGQFTLAGVISWGSAQCNQKATVLTDIAQYAGWISDTIGSTSEG